MKQRDERGRFLPGNSIGTGRPPRETEREYLNIMLAAVTPDKWRKIVNRAIADAITGDGKAREWLANYLIGRPPHTLEISAPDAAALREILDLLKQRDISASSVFEAMLNELVEADARE